MTLEVTILIISLLAIASTASAINPEFQTSLNNFNQNLFSQLKASHGHDNIIYSPFSIQTCLAMARMGADGQTAVVMDRGLRFVGQTPESVAENYHSLLAQYEHSDILKIANKVYVADNYELKPDYKRLLTHMFFSSAENINFSQSRRAAHTMNTWVESKTNHKITNLISPDSLDESTRVVLLNAIHFNGKWAAAFDRERTREGDFMTEGNKYVKVPMMSRRGEFQLGDSRELQAYVLRMPYKDSDLSMLVILPFWDSNLSQLLEELKQFQLKSLSNILRPKSSLVVLPKFKAEFEIELNDALEKMGMKQMFEVADFSKMLKYSDDVTISKVIHKAVIEVNEEGTEAAAATAVFQLERVASDSFTANRPFVYIVVNNDYVPLFQGTVVEF